MLPGASTDALRLPFGHLGVSFEAKYGDLSAFLNKILSQKQIEDEKSLKKVNLRKSLKTLGFSMVFKLFSCAGSLFFDEN